MNFKAYEQSSERKDERTFEVFLFNFEEKIRKPFSATFIFKVDIHNNFFALICVGAAVLYGSTMLYFIHSYKQSSLLFESRQFFFQFWNSKFNCSGVPNRDVSNPRLTFRDQMLAETRSFFFRDHCLKALFRKIIYFLNKNNKLLLSLLRLSKLFRIKNFKLQQHFASIIREGHKHFNFIK